MKKSEIIASHEECLRKMSVALSEMCSQMVSLSLECKDKPIAICLSLLADKCNGLASDATMEQYFDGPV